MSKNSKSLLQLEYLEEVDKNPFARMFKEKVNKPDF